mgnify:CR=1 FL=1
MLCTWQTIVRHEGDFRRSASNSFSRPAVKGGIWLSAVGRQDQKNGHLYPRSDDYIAWRPEGSRNQSFHKHARALPARKQPKCCEETVKSEWLRRRERRRRSCSYACNCPRYRLADSNTGRRGKISQSQRMAPNGAKKRMRCDPHDRTDASLKILPTAPPYHRLHLFTASPRSPRVIA